METVNKDEKILYEYKTENLLSDNIKITDKRIYINKSEEQKFITINNKNISRIDFQVNKKEIVSIVPSIILIFLGIVFLTLGIIFFKNESFYLLLFLGTVLLIIGTIALIKIFEEKDKYQKGKLILYYDNHKIEIFFADININELIKIRNLLFLNIKNNI